MTRHVRDRHRSRPRGDQRQQPRAERARALPEEVRRQGVQVAKRSPSFLKIIALDSDDPRFDAVFISNYALLNVVDELRRIPGVGDVQIFGSKDYSIRIWLRPDALAKLGLTPGDVAAAIREQNAQFAAGRVGDEPMNSAVEFHATPSRRRAGSPARRVRPHRDPHHARRAASCGSQDVARVELGSRDYDFSSMRNGKPTVPIGVFLQPGRQCAGGRRATLDARMEELAKRFPAGLDVQRAVRHDRVRHASRSTRCSRRWSRRCCSCSPWCSCSCRTGARRSSRCWPCRCR